MVIQVDECCDCLNIFYGYFYVSFTMMTSESYGEDIADTDTQRSCDSDEDAYEDSFIDDGDLEAIIFSPVCRSEGTCTLEFYVVQFIFPQELSHICIYGLM